MASNIEDGHLYYVLSYGGTLTLDLAGGDSADNTRVIGWTPHFDQERRNRVWRFHAKGNSWQLINLASGTALTLKNGSSNNGTEVVGSQPFESDRQLWRFDASQNNAQVTSWTVRNKASNTALDLAGGGASDGTNVNGWDHHGGWNQKWILIPVNN